MIGTAVLVGVVGLLLGGCVGWLARGRRCRIAHAHLVARHEPGDLETFLGPEAEPETTVEPATASAAGTAGTTGTTVAPTGSPTPSGVRPGRFAGSALSGPDGAAPDPAYVVKGKVRSRIYRAPGSTAYTTTVADVWFRSVEDAEAAGFRKPRQNARPGPATHETSPQA